MTLSLSERLWAKVNCPNPDECWLWTGHTVRGYGRLRYDSRYIYAHRAAYMLLIGPIPDGLVLDHLCRVPRCCNPAHLEPVTHRVNIMRGIATSAVNASKVTCIHGHPFDEINTYITPTGQRKCRRCMQVRKKQKRLLAQAG